MTLEQRSYDHLPEGSPEAIAFGKVESILHKVNVIHSMPMGYHASPDFDALRTNLENIMQNGLLAGYKTGHSDLDEVWWEVSEIGDSFRPTGRNLGTYERVVGLALRDLPCRTREDTSSSCEMFCIPGICFILDIRYTSNDLEARDRKTPEQILPSKIKGVVIINHSDFRFNIPREAVLQLRADWADSQKSRALKKKASDLLIKDDGDFELRLGLKEIELQVLVGIVKASPNPRPVYLEDGSLIWPAKIDYDDIG